jgi:hypothetical protein
MPRNRRIGKARNPAVDFGRYRVSLTFKHDFFGDLGGVIPRQDELKQAWRILRSSILDKFLLDHPQHAGRRPWGFWVFDLGMDEAPDWDAQERYLKQHGLLTPEEERVLAQRREQQGRSTDGRTRAEERQ